MARLAKFQVTRTKRGWKLNVPESLSPTGKRQELYFPSRDKATDRAAELREAHRQHGIGAAILPPALADDAFKAWELIRHLDISLTQLARQHLIKVEKEERSRPLSEALAAWVATFEGRLRPDTIDSYVATSKLLLKAGSEVTLTNLDPEAVSLAIAGQSYSLHRRNTSAFLHWSARAPRKWCNPKSILGEMESSGSTKQDGEIDTIAPELVHMLLNTAADHFPNTVGKYAVGFFGGLRQEELAKLLPGDVRSEGIEIGARIAKKRLRRFVPMSDTLRAWLDAYPFEEVANWDQKNAAVRRLTGWDVTSKLLTNPNPPTLGKWPRNGIRHTHASAEIANGATLEDLLFRFGHTDGPEMLRSHYVGRYTKDQAAAFFALRPKSSIQLPTKHENSSSSVSVQ